MAEPSTTTTTGAAPARPTASALDPMVPWPAVVRDRRGELPDTVTLTLAPLDASRWHGFRPGQFTMMYLPGVGEIPVSISGDPADPATIVQTIRAVGRVSEALCALRPGAAIGLRGPFGTPWPIAEARGNDVLIVAGGLGLAPTRPILYEVLANRAAYGSVSLLYGTRSPEALLFREELGRWRARLDLEVEVTVDHAGPDWRGRVGVVTRLLPSAPFEPAETSAFVCGPEIMMRVVARELAAAGIPDAQIWLSLERSMKCGVGYCGHCQLGPDFLCKDGPVLSLAHLGGRLAIREL